MDDPNTPKVLVTYVFSSNHANKPFIRQKHNFRKDLLQESKSKRYIGESPLVFVRKDLINDMETLYVANLIYTSIHSKHPETRIDCETKLKMFYKNTIALYKTWNNLSEEIITNERISIERPDSRFIAYDSKMFEDSAMKIQLEQVKKLQ
jgi:hypothetical protein